MLERSLNGLLGKPVYNILNNLLFFKHVFTKALSLGSICLYYHKYQTSLYLLVSFELFAFRILRMRSAGLSRIAVLYQLVKGFLALHFLLHRGKTSHLKFTRLSRLTQLLNGIHVGVTTPTNHLNGCVRPSSRMC
jgi:hypothetical protein